MTTSWQGSAEFDEHPTRALLLMCNASSAGADRNDPTIHRCIELLRPLVDGFTVVNWEPHISAEPKELYAWRDRAGRDHFQDYQQIRDRNVALIRALSKAAPLRIVAWGRLVPQVRLTTIVLQALSGDGAHDLYTFGLTKDGSPTHPMARGKNRIPSGTKPIIWRAGRSAAA